MIRRVAILVVFVCLACTVALAGDGDKKFVVNDQMVLFGTSQKFTKPAIVNTAEVFKNIPAYKQIQADKLTEKDAKYWILLEQANKDFNKALAEVAKAGSNDLVTEVGGVTSTTESVPDLTEAVSKKFKS